MKYLLIPLILLSGCATVSEYNQGCRDALTAAYGQPESITNPYCDYLDKEHQMKKNLQKK
jgi:hypothetical protein